MSYGTVQAEKVTTESGYSLGAGNASSFKNRVINGGMTIDQRNAGSSITPSATSTSTYFLDRWNFYNTAASKLTYQQSNSVYPSGFAYSMAISVASAYSPTGGDAFSIEQPIEAFNTSDFNFGTASAISITVSFWVRSSLTGTFSGSVKSASAGRSYPFTYTIDSANTWEKKSVTIPGDTSGTWVSGTNGVGIRLVFDMGCSANRGTANSWQSSNINGVTGTVQLVANAGANWYITGVQLEVGTVATSFDFRSFGTELALCQRYFTKTYDINVVPAFAGNYSGAMRTTAINTTTYMSFGSWSFPASMRSTPTIVTYNPQTGTTNSFVGDGVNYTGVGIGNTGQRGVDFFANNVSVGTSVFMSVHATASAEL